MSGTPISSMPALPVTRATREAAEGAAKALEGDPEAAVLRVLGGLPMADAPACIGQRATMPAALCAGCTWAPGCELLPPPPALP